LTGGELASWRWSRVGPSAARTVQHRNAKRPDFRPAVFLQHVLHSIERRYFATFDLRMRLVLLLIMVVSFAVRSVPGLF
jgi:hypothetical protein